MKLATRHAFYRPADRRRTRAMAEVMREPDTKVFHF